MLLRKFVCEIENLKINSRFILNTLSKQSCIGFEFHSGVTTLPVEFRVTRIRWSGIE
jgi:hypothetical protein